MLRIVTAEKDRDAPAIRELFREYLEWACPITNREYGAPFSAAAILAEDMQHLDKFMQPAGRLLLAYVDDRLAGVACLKILNAEIAEIKRMYVRPEARGKGVGRALVDRLLDQAREAGYRRVRLDSASFMTDAHRLYRAAGFQDIGPYEGSEIPEEFRKHWVFMELELP
jgi:GNAT superfamily N-acetyltransferase